MALYKITNRKADTDARPRLVKADTAAAALRHVAATQFDVAVVRNAVSAAELTSSGIVMEIAGEPVPKAPLLLEETEEDNDNDDDDA